MGKIYKNQSALRMNFNLDEDITNYSTVLINVKYPGASTTSWTAIVSDASTGAVYYDAATTTVLKSARKYLLQPDVTFADGSNLKGETQELIVYDDFE